MKRLELVTPGEILLEEWLKPLGVSQYRLAVEIGVSPRRINEIVHGKRAITADTALRLARFFGTDAQSWLNLQSHYDLEIAKHAIAGKSGFSPKNCPWSAQRRATGLRPCCAVRAEGSACYSFGTTSWRPAYVRSHHP